MVTRIGKWMTSEGIQPQGGYGMTEEYKVGRYFKRLLTMDALFGRIDYHLNRYADAKVS
jgi:alkylation response protein AidB-like acyl-CoA dehydrogenase